MFEFLTPPFVIAILLALSFHEWAHGYAAFRLGDPTAKYEGRLTLNPIAHLDPIGTLLFLTVGFGWGKPVPINPRYFRHYHRDTAIVSLAGPASNLVLAIISFGLIAVFIPNGLSAQEVQFPASAGPFLPFLHELLMTSLIVNLVLMAFNLLPIAPLDGSKILAAFIPLKFSDQYEDFMRFGPFILLGLLILGRSAGFDPLSTWIHMIINPIMALLFSLAA